MDTVKAFHPVRGDKEGIRTQGLTPERCISHLGGMKITGSIGAHLDLDHPPISQEQCARREPTLLGGNVCTTHAAWRGNCAYTFGLEHSRIHYRGTFKSA